MATHKTGVKASSLQERVPIKADVNGTSIFIVSVAGKVYAMTEACSHHGGPLEQGSMDGNVITCPWHGAKFDVTTAKVSAETPWAEDLRSYSAIVDPTGEIVIEM